MIGALAEMLPADHVFRPDIAALDRFSNFRHRDAVACEFTEVLTSVFCPVVPLVEVCRRLEHAEVLPIDVSMQPLFRDVTDHVLLRLKRALGLVRPNNEITRKLAAWAAMLAVPTP